MENQEFNNFDEDKKRGKLTKKGKYTILVISTIVFSAISIGITVKSFNEFNNNEPDTTTNYTYDNTASIQDLYPDNDVVNNNDEQTKQANAQITDPVDKKVAAEVVKGEEKNEKEEEFIFHKPADGPILKEYSMEELLFSKTTNDWRVHTGIDIKSETGNAVRSIEAGKVESIKNDPFYGITIVIVHKNGYKSMYSNLASDKMVKVGQEVTRDQVIGGIGNTAYIEVMEESHLHFELYKDGNNIDPTKLLGY